MPKISTLSAILALLIIAMPWTVSATMGTIDAVPSATLLFPYFEVDLGAIDGITTLVTLQNTSAAPALVHVTLWTNAAVPTTAFDLYLTGYDVQPMNVRDIFNASPSGLVEAHLGGPSELFGGQCAGIDFGDFIVRGYITADNVSVASAADVFPGDTGYFLPGGLGIANNDNVLTGDFMFIDPANNFAQSETAVHIEADASFGTPGVYTFYGREVLGTGADNREPLPTVLSASVTRGLTELVAWRDTGIPGTPFTCGTYPLWVPLGQEQIVPFDTETNPEIAGPFVSYPFPFAVSRTLVGGPAFPVDIGKAGWIYMNLNETGALPGAPFGRLRQAWVWGVTQDEDLGRFSHGNDAIQLRNASEESIPGHKLERLGGAR